MSYAPQSLLDVRDYVQTQTGLSDNELGIVGDTAHKTGYHLGKDRTTSKDYSRQLQRDISGLTNAASASDIGFFPALEALTAFLLRKASSGGTSMIRAINGPMGGRAYRWDSQDGWVAEIKPAGDSHERHVHVEWFRDTEFQPKVWLFQEFFEGGDDMFAKYKDIGPKVRYMQIRIIKAGGWVGPQNATDRSRPYDYADGSFGDNTVAGLKALINDPTVDGTDYNEWVMNAVDERVLDVKLAGLSQGPADFVGMEFIATGKFTHKV